MSIVQFEQYKTYKDSSVDWLREVPKHWGIIRVKDTVKRIGNGVTPKGGSSVYADVGIPFLRSQNVYDDGLRINNVSFISQNIHNDMKSSALKVGDILINITGASIGRTCVVPLGLDTANINQHIAFLRIKSQYNIKYISLFLKSPFIKNYIQFEQNGASKEAFNLSQIANIPLVLPESFEQIAIANYLDKNTAQIDCKIDLLSQKAAKYSQLKQSLINETVTRGLDKTVPLKDSGVEWIGKVPEHWEVKRGKDVFEQTKNKAGQESSSYDVLSLTLKGVIKRDLDNMKGKIPASFDGYQIANPDNLVLCLFDMDVTPRIVGYVNQLGIITSAYSVLMGKGIAHMKYFLYYYLEQNRNGSLLANSKTLRSTMTFDLFSQLILPLPPIDEQQSIAKYLDKKTTQIDSIVETINTQIEKLKELRKTLINDVVTGKIKVVQEEQTA